MVNAVLFRTINAGPCVVITNVCSSCGRETKVMGSQEIPKSTSVGRCTKPLLEDSDPIVVARLRIRIKQCEEGLCIKMVA